jgi:hypothetical protein
MMRSLGFKAQQTNPRKKTRFKERAWSSPFPHSFGCKRETHREREREREEMEGGTGGYEDEKR